MRQPSPRLRRPAILLTALALTLAAIPAQATVPLPEDLSESALRAWLPSPPPGDREVPEPLGPFNYLREFDQMVHFLSIWQVDDPLDPDYGGMIEAESGDLGGVIQTDNTLEAIWCWARYREFSGRTTYDDNIAAAWVYCTNYPAWQEEGGALDYYRVHNCAWGLTAALQYEAATGDTTYRAYAETCAQYIVDHELIIDGSIWYQYLDAFCKGWAAGNLWLYGEAVGNPTYQSAAVAHGADLMSWMEADPAVRFAAEYWAMSSGTSMWGLCTSILNDEPGLAETWLPTVYHHMDVWEDWYSVPGYVWDGAWNVAYCNAHFAVWDHLHDDLSWENGKFGADALLSLDTDDDGGIKAETIDEDDEDMTWVSCYLIKFGVDRLMGDPFDHDVGVLRFVGLEDGMRIMPGESVPIAPLATNYGLTDEPGVDVFVTGDLGDWSTVADLDFAELDSIVFAGAIPIPEAGTYTVTAFTARANDMDPMNDAVTVTILVGEDTGVPGDHWPASRAITVTENPFRERTGFRFSLAQSASVRLQIYDVRGRSVLDREPGVLGTGDHVLTWDGKDAAGRDLPAGLYLYRFSAGSGAETGKVLRLR